MKRKVSDYIQRGYRNVEGWSPKLTFSLTTEVAAIQDQWEVQGPVCEIGVHHGQLLILLHLLSRVDEKTVGWDLFERQEENPYLSGKGNRDKTEAHLQAFGCDLNRVELHEVNSLELTSAMVIKQCGGRPRLFSIDGGHTADIVFHDLQLAANTICDDGVVILDDLFSEPFPDVGRGFYRFMEQNSKQNTKYCTEGRNSGLFPFLIGGNKVFLARNDAAADRYIRALPDSHVSHETRTTTFCDREVMVVIRPYSPLKFALQSSGFWRSFREKPAGIWLRKQLKTTS